MGENVAKVLPNFLFVREQVEEEGTFLVTKIRTEPVDIKSTRFWTSQLYLAVGAITWTTCETS